jgi:phage terminase large subunit-like protein
MSRDETRGERVCGFIEKHCRIPSGDQVGKPMRLEAFQKKFIIEIYDNAVGTRRAYLSIARKNGKTALIAAIVLAHVAGPEARQNTQIISGAQSRDQAGIVFDLASKMVQLSPELSRVTRIIPSSKRIIGLIRNVEYHALSAEGKTAHGLSPVLAILDEVGQVEGPRDAFISAIVTSQGAYENPLLIAISTQAASDTDLFSAWLDSQEAAPDPRCVSHVYRAPEDCELSDRTAWFAANPALGKFKALADLEQAARLAELIPANESEFRNFHLNQRVEKTDPFVSRTVWEANGAQPESLTGKKVYAGLDLASVNDLCALVLATQEGDIEAHFWLPAVGLFEKAKKDRVPWDLWAQQGLLHTTPGKAVEYEYVAEFLRGVFDRCEVQALAFDRYNMKHLKPWLVKAQFSEAELAKFIEFGQGTLSMTPALRELEVQLLNGKIKHGMNPIMTMCAANARTVGASGARKFDKIKSRGRIDGMVAMAQAIGVMPSSQPAPEYRVFVL